MTEYPNYGGAVDCAAGTFNGLPYSGNLTKITAPDPMTIVFEFCNPDVAFLSQIAFSSLAIDDAGYLIAHMPTSVTGEEEPLPETTILVAPNGTGPYMVPEGGWDRGNRLDMEAFADYWGEKAKTPLLEFQWNDDSAARYLAMQGGDIDGFNNPAKTDLTDIEGNADFTLYPRSLQSVEGAQGGFNTFYVGMNNTYKPWSNVKVRKAVAMAIDRQRIIDNFFPPGSVVADYFTPCSIPFSCGGDKWPHAFDVTAAKALFDEGMAEESLDPATFTTEIQYRPSVRDYLPDPPAIAQDIAAQLTANLGITVEDGQQVSGEFLDNNAAGTLDGLFLLGWLGDFPDTSNFLDYHFGPATGLKFGDPYAALVEAIRTGNQSPADADREAAYAEANNIINENVPMVLIAHGSGSAVFRTEIQGGHSSPLNNEIFSVMEASDGSLVWMQSSEPLSLYCSDETDGESFRACVQIKEALYGYAVGGDDPEPSLATGCTPNENLTVWTCQLREGVKFHDQADFAADDVIASFAAQWDALSPQHIGRTGAFEYWSALIGGGFLNPQ